MSLLEACAGLDPWSRRLLWECIRKAKKDRAIMLTTHNMEEAQGLCDRSVARGGREGGEGRRERVGGGQRTGGVYWKSLSNRCSC